MRLYIRTGGKRNIRIPIPLPMWILRIGLSSYSKEMIRKYGGAQAVKYIDAIDFNALYNGFADLKNYKGLTLVEVKQKDGTEITIIV